MLSFLTPTAKKVALVLLVTFSVLTGPAQAANSFALGYDLARQLDQNQDEGQVNLNFQFAVGRRSAITTEVAVGERIQAYELGFKRYNEKFLSGSFFQLGVGYWNGDKDKGAKSKFALEARTGYELPLTPSLVAFGAVSMVYGPNNPITNEEKELMFRPHLGLRFHF